MKQRDFIRSWFSRYASRYPKKVRDVLQIVPKGPSVARKRKKPTHIRGVRNGNYFRLPIPSKPSRRRPVIGTPTAKTKPSSTMKQPASRSGVPSKLPNSSWRPLAKWFRSNLPVLILNFGSICILVGFSRSDVLELRTLTMTGQLTFAAYNLGQATILWPSVLWSGIFASVNGFKILNVFQERTAEVFMTKEQERVFVDYFMDHGVTPLQFTWIEDKAKVIRIRKGKALIEKGGHVDKVFLVINGSTHAHVFGQKLTAVSTNVGTRGDQLEGGDSGAWIGEMAFLDWLHRREDTDYSGVDASQSTEQMKLGRGEAMYTILADEDCTVMSWSHEDMASLLETSSDLRSALTRAMTAAVVGKVVNLAIGDNMMRSNRGWTEWLSAWKRNQPVDVQLEPSK